MGRATQPRSARPKEAQLGDDFTLCTLFCICFCTMCICIFVVCVQCVFVYLLFVYLQICVFAVGHVRLLLASAVSSHSLVEAPLIRFLCNIRLKKNENMIKTKKV